MEKTETLVEFAIRQISTLYPEFRCEHDANEPDRVVFYTHAKLLYRVMIEIKATSFWVRSEELAKVVEYVIGQYIKEYPQICIMYEISEGW